MGKKILDVVGIESDSEKVGIVVKELAGKNLEELIAEGNSKLASVPSGGGAAAPAAAAGGAAAPEAAAVEEKEEEKEESDDDMGFGLFDQTTISVLINPNHVKIYRSHLVQI